MAGFEPVWEAGGRKDLHFQEAISCGTNGAEKLQTPVVQQQSRSGGGRTRLLVPVVHSRKLKCYQLCELSQVRLGKALG